MDLCTIVEARTKLGEEYVQLFAQLQEHRSWVRISGVLLIYDMHALHVIESPPDVILDIVAVIREHENGGSTSRLRNSRVLYSYDVSTPTFPIYAFRSVQLSSTMGYKMQESPDIVAADCVVTSNLLGRCVTHTLICRSPTFVFHRCCPATSEEISPWKNAR